MSTEFKGRMAMGAIGSPVALITASFGGKKNVTTVNMIAGLSFAPPLVGISLSHHSLSRELLENSGEFAFNFLSPDHMELIKKLGSTSGHKMDKFEEFDIETLPGEVTDTPLLKAAHTTLECTVENSMDIGKQIFYVGRVVAYRAEPDGWPIYLYHGDYYNIGGIIGSFRGK